MADGVLKNIIDDILLAEAYSIIVDETQYLFKHEQVLIVKYITKKCCPVDVFLGLYKTEYRWEYTF